MLVCVTHIEFDPGVMIDLQEHGIRELRVRRTAVRRVTYEYSNRFLRVQQPSSQYRHVPAVFPYLFIQVWLLGEWSNWKINLNQ